MSVFSIIRPLPQPVRNGDSLDDWDDPLVDAWELLEDACRVRFVDSTPEVWRREFGRKLEGVVLHVLAHVGRFGGSDSPLKGHGTQGEQREAIRTQSAEHNALLEQASWLVSHVQEKQPLTPGSVLEFVERAIALQIALARHQNRLVDFLESRRLQSGFGRTAVSTAVRAG